MTILFETIHGSHLYGLNHAKSDLDVYRVVSEKGKNYHRVKDMDDITIVSLDSFLRQAEKGVPQALEAMWSSNPSVDGIQALRAGFRPNIPNTLNTYSRTIFNFLKNPELKMMRHAVRLSMCLRDLYDYGAFEPTLNELDKMLILDFKSIDQLEEARAFCEYLSPIELFRETSNG